MLAAFGTALPESVVTFVAVVFGTTPAAKDIGVGAALGGPLVLAVVQAVITSRTLYLGGTTVPVKFMNDVQLRALDHGYTYGLLWVAGVAVLTGGVALLIGYTSKQVAHAQEVQHAIDVGEI